MESSKVTGTGGSWGQWSRERWLVGINSPTGLSVSSFHLCTWRDVFSLLSYDYQEGLSGAKCGCVIQLSASHNEAGVKGPARRSCLSAALCFLAAWGYPGTYLLTQPEGCTRDTSPWACGRPGFSCHLSSSSSSEAAWPSTERNSCSSSAGET